MSESIRLHKTLGVNPRLTVCQCPICLKEHDGSSLLLFGDHNRVDTCATCNTEIYGGLSSSRPCPKCKGTYASKTREMGDSERVPAPPEPCDQCKEWMKVGIILFSVSDEDQSQHTGKLAVLKEEAVKRFVKTPSLLKQILEKRVTAVGDESWKALGLPE